MNHSQSYIALWRKVSSFSNLFLSCLSIVLSWFWYVHPQSLIVSPFHFGMSQNVSHPGKSKKKLVNFPDLTNRTDIVERRDIFSLLLFFLFNVSLFSWQLILGGLWAGHSDAGLRPPIGHGKDLRIKPEAEKKNIKTMTSISKHKEDHEIDMTVLDVDILAPPPPPPPPPFLSVDKVTVNPIFAPVTMTGHSNRSPNSVRSFTIASLQQFTNSFSQANLIGGGMLGTVYRAELPIGKVTFFWLEFQLFWCQWNTVVLNAHSVGSIIPLSLCENGVKV